jgi:hypothetical protein
MRREKQFLCQETTKINGEYQDFLHSFTIEGALPLELIVQNYG